MKKLLVLVVALVLIAASSAFAADVALEWDPNTEEDLVGYRMFHRQVGQEYDYNIPSWEGTFTTCIVTVAGSRDYLFVARAFDEDGNESDNSNEVRFVNKPGAPCLLRFP